jgi:hypothetical protein
MKDYITYSILAIIMFSTVLFISILASMTCSGIAERERQLDRAMADNAMLKKELLELDAVEAKHYKYSTCRYTSLNRRLFKMGLRMGTLELKVRELEDLLRKEQEEDDSK